MALKVNYLKNVIKSVAFTAAEITEDIAPNVSEFAKASKDLAKMTYSKIRLPNASSRRRMAGYLNSLIFKPMDNAWQNVKSDLRTGSFYNKEREEQASMESFGGGFNFDDLDDFDLEGGKEAASDELLSSKTFSAGDVAITRSIEGAVGASTQSTISSILASTDSNIKAARANAAMAFEQRERIFGVSHNDAQTSNSILNSIFELNKKLVVNIDKNLAVYQTEQQWVMDTYHEIEYDTFYSAADKGEEVETAYWGCVGMFDRHLLNYFHENVEEWCSNGPLPPVPN